MTPSNNNPSSQLHRPPCGQCGTLTDLVRVEPSPKPDHDLRTFACPACGHAETVEIRFR